jgi:RNA polymerase sigma-70 factor (ECF subfamily)
MAISEEEFGAIVRTHQLMLYRIAFNFFRNAATAEEVVQDVLLKLFESSLSAGSPEYLQSWLRRAATNRCIDLARRKERQMETYSDETVNVVAEIPEADPLLDQYLATLVASLPETQRLIVILHYGEEMDSQEIAETLHMPSSTVRSHLQRALVLLRNKASRLVGERTHEST